MTDTTTALVASLSSLSLQTSSTRDGPAILQLTSTPPPTPTLPHKKATKPFPFLSLPAELRLRIYEHLLILPTPIDLDPSNTRHLGPRLAILLANKQLHTEASHVFYTHNTFRLFPTHGRFFHTKRPLLTRLAPHQRALITKLELRLGPGWTQPPACWNVGPRLGLCDMDRLRRLDVFIECDPAADAVFAGFRQSETFYTEFCVEILVGLMKRVPALEVVGFDMWESVKWGNSPLLREPMGRAREEGKEGCREGVVC